MKATRLNDIENLLEEQNTYLLTTYVKSLMYPKIQFVEILLN